ncbi:unnamed protein product [Clonostachys rosea f. rosea IK726]|uniref:Uncharacterized protein n=1 Tax=Clonostachys rosea f. rosea IK726 TaxID=1349383 RepID=A0ACA9UTC0_BIOOC|nr:unnamed protein product [Clonostachys rosea f. rosea IK726]
MRLRIAHLRKLCQVKSRMPGIRPPFVLAAAWGQEKNHPGRHTV